MPISFRFTLINDIFSHQTSITTGKTDVMQQSIHSPGMWCHQISRGGGAVNWEWKGNYISSYHILSIALPLVWSLGPHTQKDYLNHFFKNCVLQDAQWFTFGWTQRHLKPYSFHLHTSSTMLTTYFSLEILYSLYKFYIFYNPLSYYFSIPKCEYLCS